MRNLKSNIFIVLGMTLIISLLNISDAKAEFKIKSWEYYKEIDSKNLEIGKSYRTVLDKNIYDLSQVSLDDLRIVTDEKAEIPYEISVINSQTETTNMVSKILENSTKEDNSNVLILDLGESIQKNNKLSLDTTDHNFGKKVTVEGSNDNTNWAILAKDCYIYDFSFGGEGVPKGGQIKWQRAINSKYMVDFSYNTSSRDTSISYAENNNRYLKITIFGTKDEDSLSIAGANIASYYFIPAEETEYNSLVKETKIDEKEKKSETILDFGTKNLPLHSLKISSNSTNYYRTIYLQGSNDLTSWSYIGNGEIFDYNIENFRNSKKEISFSEVRFRYLKLIVLNQDNPPINIDSVIGTSLNRSIIFPYQMNGSLRLYYGSQLAKRPTYDYSRYVRMVDIRKIKILSISRQFQNPLYVFEKIKRPWTEERPYLLWLTLLGMVVILLFLVASMIKKVK